MSVVYADIELINSTDLVMARRNLIGEDEIKHMRLSMLMDSGAYMMAINETIQSRLEFPFMKEESFCWSARRVNHIL
jgi:hypothetical protein